MAPWGLCGATQYVPCQGKDCCVGDQRLRGAAGSTPQLKGNSPGRRVESSNRRDRRSVLKANQAAAPLTMLRIQSSDNCIFPDR